MHSRTDPRYVIVDKDGKLIRIASRAFFRIESVICRHCSNLIAISLCFDLGKVVDESGCNGLSTSTGGVCDRSKL